MVIKSPGFAPITRAFSESSKADPVMLTGKKDPERLCVVVPATVTLEAPGVMVEKVENPSTVKSVFPNPVIVAAESFREKTQAKKRIDAVFTKCPDQGFKLY